MISYISTVLCFLRNRSQAVQFFIVFSLIVLYSALASFLVSFLDSNVLKNSIDYESIFVKIVSGVVISPYLETHFLQYLPFKKIKTRVRYKFLISAVLFGGTHIIYNFYYALIAIGLGALLSIPFLVHSNNLKRAFRSAFALHVFNNLLYLIEQ